MPVLAQIKKTSSTEELYYFYNDDLGSKRASIKASTPTEVEVFEYTAFGEVIVGSEDKAAFTGKQMDATGLYYFNARYYDPEVKRFLTQDLAKQGSGWYTYCNNNPINLVDPDGRQEKTPKQGYFFTLKIGQIEHTYIALTKEEAALRQSEFLKMKIYSLEKDLTPVEPVQGSCYESIYIQYYEQLKSYDQKRNFIEVRHTETLVISSYKDKIYKVELHGDAYSPSEKRMVGTQITLEE